MACLLSLGAFARFSLSDMAKEAQRGWAVGPRHSSGVTCLWEGDIDLLCSSLTVLI